MLGVARSNEGRHRPRRGRLADVPGAALCPKLILGSLPWLRSPGRAASVDGERSGWVLAVCLAFLPLLRSPGKAASFEGERSGWVLAIFGPPCRCYVHRERQHLSKVSAPVGYLHLSCLCVTFTGKGSISLR